MRLQERWLTLAVAGFCGLAGGAASPWFFGRTAAGASNQSDADIIRAKRIEIFDAAGRVRTVLGAAPGDADSFDLVILNRTSQPREVLAVSGEGNSVLGLLDTSGKPRLELGIMTGFTFGGDNYGLRISDAGGDTASLYGSRFALGSHAGDTFIGLGWYAGDATLSLTGKGEALIRLEGKFRDTLADLKKPLGDKSLNPQLSLVADADDASVNLYDRSGNARATLGAEDLRNSATESTEHRSESSLVLFRENGKVLWEAP